MADRADAFQDAARLLDEELARLAASADALATRTPVSPRERVKAIKYAVTSFARNVQFVVRVKGQHYSGLSNEALFEVRANEGRDFLERTVQMDQWVRREMLVAFDGFERVPTLDDLRKLHTKLVIQYIANVRFARGGGDLILTPLTSRYAAYKRKAGRGARPIGVWSGKHLAALRAQGYLEYR